MANGLSTRYIRTGVLAPTAQAAFLAQQQRQECTQAQATDTMKRFCPRHFYDCPKAR